MTIFLYISVFGSYDKKVTPFSLTTTQYKLWTTLLNNVWE